MKISAKKIDWELAVQVGFLASAGNEDSGVPGYFLIRFVSGGAELLGCNNHRQVAGGPVLSATLVEGKDGEKFLVPARRMRNLLTLCADEDEITIDHVNGVSKAVTPYGESKWGSADPQNFPVVDEPFKSAVLTAEVSAPRLVSILNYARAFTSDQETRNPALVAMECRDGVLTATNSVGVAMISSPLLEKSKLRLHNKDVGAVTAFLSMKGSEVIEILEHDRCLIVRRKDGRFFAVGRWVHEFPSLKLPRDAVPKCTFTVTVADLARALRYIDVFAKEKDTHLICQPRGGQVALRMASASGDSDFVEQSIPSTDKDIKLLADAGHQQFALSKDFVEILVRAFEAQKEITFGVNWTPVNGYVTVSRQDDGDDYFTTIVWLKK